MKIEYPRPETTIGSDAQAVKALRQRLHGRLLQRGDEGYDDARKIWNGMIDRYPALIARCAEVNDVIAAVDFARENEMLVAVRGGGHSVAGHSTCDGGLVIDLSSMRAVQVDPEARTVRVQGGATWSDVDRETQRFGLATPGGIISTTGVGGLTLGGGMGWLSRKHGLSCDNLLSAGIVTADGELVRASEDENPDLFWGIRGGSGNFGIATSLELQLHEVGPEVLFGPIVYRYEDAPEVLRHYREFARNAPNECSVWVDSLFAPPLPFLPESAHGSRALFLASFYAGDLEEGEEVLRPLRSYGEPIADAVSRVPYTEVQSGFDPLYAKGARNYWKSHNFVELSDGAIDTLVAYANQLPTPQSDILIHQVGGRVNEVAPDATAYPHREARYVVTPGGRWEDPSQDDAPVSWVREWYDASAKHATGGVYVNFISEREGRERDAYGGNYARLIELKRRYDPTNFLRLNQNIAPGE